MHEGLPRSGLLLRRLLGLVFKGLFVKGPRFGGKARCPFPTYPDQALTPKRAPDGACSGLEGLFARVPFFVGSVPSQASENSML